MKNQKGKVTVGDIPSLIMKLKSSSDVFNEDEIRQRLGESHSDINEEVDFEGFLRVSFSTSFIPFELVVSQAGGRWFLDFDSKWL